MSLALVRGVLTTSKAKAATRLVLVILASYANEKRRSRPSVATIAALANVSGRCVQLALKELLKLGEVRIETNGGGRNRPTVYEITAKSCSPFELTEKVKSMKGVSDSDSKIHSPGETVNTSSPEGVYAEKASTLSLPKNGHALRDADSFSLYSEEERRVIELFHSILVSLGAGWLEVTKFTKTVRAVIAKLSFERWQGMLAAAAKNPDNWPKGHKTLVRLYWHVSFPAGHKPEKQRPRMYDAVAARDADRRRRKETEAIQE